MCPFCDTVDVFAESASSRVLYNIAPILPGHSLVVPRRHVTSMLELTDEELTDLALFSRRAVRILLEAFRAEAFNWTVQEGEAAGQTMPHLHLHLIPRFRDDLPSPGAWYPRLREWYADAIDSAARPRLSPSERADIVAHLREVAAKVA